LFVADELLHFVEELDDGCERLLILPVKGAQQRLAYIR
jgi:hypothetical protein